MRAEIITIGEELLSGQTVDTNSAFIAKKLADAGIEVAWKTTVGDRLEDIQAAIRTAWERSEVVISTGGLGPTIDDITKKAICAAFERKLVFHDEIVKIIEERYKRHNAKMPALAQNQALQPQGASFIENKIGSAVGIVFNENGHYFAALPGVPLEMQLMIEEGVVPYFRDQRGREYIEVRKIRTVGITEVQIAEIIADLQPSNQNLKLAYLPSYLGVDLRITAKCQSKSDAKQQVEQLLGSIKNRIGEHIYTIGEQTLVEVIGALLKIRRVTISTAESCTGGLIAKSLTDTPGSSAYFPGSVVAYANEVKMATLRVPEDILIEVGAVSAEVAAKMAEGVRELTGSDYSLSTTGIAGPSGGTVEKPVGLVYVGLSTPEGTETTELHLKGDRDRIRYNTMMFALDLLRRKLIGV